ncbi:MAG: thioredoxin domain-containing protein [Acidobacteria bacterium]|nr:thioredoxin domain-containing protein [Acidobacteriota bacterium]
MKRLLLLSCLLALAGACGGPADKGAPEPAAGSAKPETVVAVIGAEKITLDDLDKEIRPQLLELERLRLEREHRIRQAGLENMIAEKLVKQEAAARGISEDQLFQQELGNKPTAPTEDEMRQFYRQNEQRMPGPYEQMQPQIRSYIEGEKKQRLLNEYLQGLKAKANVVTMLPPPEMPAVEVAADGPARGPENAPVTIVEFADYQCPYCAQVEPVVKRLLAEYPGKLRFVFRDYPLPSHQQAPKASEAALCAEQQGKFWEMHDRLFEQQGRLALADLKEHARAIGLDGQKFDQCLDSGAMADAVNKHAEAGKQAGVNATPAFFINGRVLSGAQPYEEFKRAIDRELARATSAS